MILSNSETLIFVHRDLLTSAKGKEALQDFFHKSPILYKNSIFKGVTEDGKLDIKKPTLAMRNGTFPEDSFAYIVAQATIDGYVYASLQSFIRLVGHPSV